MKKIEHMSIALLEGGEIRVTISVGIAELKAAHSIDETLHSVDKALYQAKEAGRNRVEVSI